MRKKSIKIPTLGTYFEEFCSLPYIDQNIFSI
jgi:hypothetical protein